MTGTGVGVKGADRTREALIMSAMYLFGHKGFAASSTREIATRAKANVAAIAYHFGGKDGLRLACAEAVVTRVAPFIDVTEAGPPPGPAEAARRLERILRSVVGFLVGSDQSAPIAAFMLREITDPGPVLDRVLATLIEPRHRALCQLWGAASGTDPESEDTRLAVFAMMGQVLYFRVGQPVILRRMGWPQVSPQSAGKIADLLVRNLHASLAATERAKK